MMIMMPRAEIRNMMMLRRSLREADVERARGKKASAAFADLKLDDELT
jgi:hypothetical protein